MDAERIPPGLRIAAVAGLLLFFDLWASWYGFEAVGPNARHVDTNDTAWQAFSLVDLILVLTALLAMAAAAAAAAGDRARLPGGFNTVLTALGALGTVLIVYRIVDEPFEDARTVRWGAYAGLVLCAALTYGAFRARASGSSRAAADGDPPPPG